MQIIAVKNYLRCEIRLKRQETGSEWLREICDVAIKRVKYRKLEFKDVKIGGNPKLIEMELVGSADCSDI